MLKSGLLLTFSNVSVSLFGLSRNVIIARLISVDDFGIASTFAIAMAVVEMASNIAVDRLIVQARDGDKLRLQSTAHAVQAARGLLGAVALFLVAEPVATLFGVPEATWAYRIMAVIPLLRGLSHLDVFRVQRELRFGPIVVVELAAQFISAVAAVPLAIYLHDYRAMLYSLIVQQLAYAVASHLAAARPYRWAWDRDVVRRATAFGWPVVINGFLLFGIFQGDRIVVGSVIGMTALGSFSAAFTLTLAPTLVVAKTLQSFFLPQLARDQDNQGEFELLYLASVQAGLLAGVLLAVFFAIAGPFLFTILYGVRYEAAIPLLAWLAVMQALRVARAGPAIVALAKGETTNPLIANFFRVATLPIAWELAKYRSSLLTIVAIAIFGELLAFLASLWLLRDRLSLPIAALKLPCVAALLLLALVCLDGQIGSAALDQVARMQVAAVVFMAALAIVVWSMRPLRHWVQSLAVGSDRKAATSNAFPPAKCDEDGQ